MDHNKNNCLNDVSHAHECSDMKTELISHFPYAVFSVALGLIGAALLDYFSFGASKAVVQQGAHTLFHSFHFMHIVFAATGSMFTFFRHSKNLFKGIAVCAISTIFFCILSDILLPYVVGSIFGVSMKLHICFVSEVYNVVPFLIIGMVNGWVLTQHGKHLHDSYSLWSHFAHILVTSLAAVLYTISNGFSDWSHHMGMFFLLLVIAVVVPCTLSDVVIPLFFSKEEKC